MAVQWLRLCAPNVGGMSSVPGWGAKIPACPAEPLPPNLTQNKKQNGLLLGGIASRRCKLTGSLRTGKANQWK